MFFNKPNSGLFADKKLLLRGILFKSLLYIVFSASQPYLVSLLGPLPDQNHSLNSLLLSLENQARVLLEKIGKASANGSVPKSGKSNEKVTEKTSDDKLAR